jgi:hypothetical protein
MQKVVHCTTDTGREAAGAKVQLLNTPGLQVERSHAKI